MPVQGLSCKSFAAPSRFGAAKRANQATSRQNSEEQGRHISNAGFPRFRLLGTKSERKRDVPSPSFKGSPTDSPPPHRPRFLLACKPARPFGLPFWSLVPCSVHTKHETRKPTFPHSVSIVCSSMSFAGVAHAVPA